MIIGPVRALSFLKMKKPISFCGRARYIGQPIFGARLLQPRDELTKGDQMEQQKATAPRLQTFPAAAARSEERGITKYANRIQGFAYGGAAALVVIIGLRSVYGRAIPSWVVISGLLLEATLLMMIAAVYYFTPEEKGGGQPSTNSLILNGEKQILALLRNDVLRGESEILHVLRNDLLNVQKDMVSVLRTEVLSSQKEIAAALRNETETRTSQQQQLTDTLRKESHQRVEQQQEILQTLHGSAEATHQQLKSLMRIDEQITMLLKNEVNNIVRMKVQEIFTSLIKSEADRRIEQQLKV